MDQETIRKAYRDVFSTVQGKVVLGDLADFCNLVACTVDPRSFAVTNLNEGRRTVVLHIMEQMGITDIANLVRAIIETPIDIRTEEQEYAETGE